MSSKKKCISAALSEDIMFFAAQYDFFFPSMAELGSRIMKMKALNFHKFLILW